MKLITDHPLNHIYPYAIRIEKLRPVKPWWEHAHTQIREILNHDDWGFSPISATLYFKTRDDAVLVKMKYQDNDKSR